MLLDSKRHRHRSRRGGIAACATAAAIVGATLVPVSASSTSSSPACSIVAATTSSPRFAICVVGAGGRAYTSTDGGRHWVAGGAVPSPLGAVVELVLSPMFATDHRLWAESTSGVYESDDAGRTFAKLTDPTDPSGGPGTPASVTFTTYVSSSGGTEHADLLLTPASVGQHGLLYDPAMGAHVGVPLPTWPNGLTIPLTPPTYEITQPAIALVGNTFGFSSVSPAHAVVPDGWYVRMCQAAMLCVQSGQRIVGAPIGVDRLAQGYSVVTLDDNTTLAQVERIAPDGSVTTWPALTAIARSLGPLGVGTAAGKVFLSPTLHVLNLSRDGRHLLAFVIDPKAFSDDGLFDAARVAQPAFQLMRSDDGGAHFHRVAYGWSPAQQPRHRDRGSWPFGFYPAGWLGATFDTPIIAIDGTGTLYATGRFSKKGASAIRCSRDGGVTWSRC